jgi:Skp family chaperone for outer membrane proteins
MEQQKLKMKESKYYLSPWFVYFSLAFSMLSLTVTCYFLLQGSSKVGVVDVNTLIKNYQAVIDFKKEYELKSSQNKIRMDTLLNELGEMKRKVEGEKLSPSVLRKTMEMIELKNKQIIEYRDYIMENSRREDEKITKKVMSEIVKNVKKYGLQKKMDVIFLDSNNGVIGFSEEKFNITDAVIRSMNEEYRKIKK